MAWLVERFGAEPIREARVVLPTDEFFPDPYDGSEDAVRRLFDRVCGYMDVDPAQITLQFYQERKPIYVYDPDGGSAGLYDARDGQTIVWLEASHLKDMECVVATLAHELGHYHLLGKGHVEESTGDHEPLTDLVPVYYGVGLFAANATIRFANWHVGAWETWGAARHGYLTASLVGYALAWFAWHREEGDPSWSRYLCPDAREALCKGLRYLEQRGGPEEVEVGQYPGYPPGAFRLPAPASEPDLEDRPEESPEDDAEHTGAVARGTNLANDGDYEGAVREYTWALSDNPNDGEVYQLRGMAYWHLGDYRKALVDGQQAVRLDPDEIDGYYLRGLAYFGLGDYGEALADFERVLDEEPKDAAAHYWIGRTLAAQGRFSQALRHYSLAVCYDPANPDFYLARAEAHDKLGNHGKAAADREEAQSREERPST